MSWKLMRTRWWSRIKRMRIDVTSGNVEVKEDEEDEEEVEEVDEEKVEKVGAG